MASVRLKFVPPVEDNIVALRIYEASSDSGPFNQIERTTQVGTYPDYIEEYTTTLAVAADDWFAITWEDADGVESDLSVAIQGGTLTIVGEIVKRVLERDGTQNEDIVRQEAEAAIEGIGLDPYADMTGLSYRQLTGLTYLVLARSIIASAVVTAAASQNIQSATLGLVSFKSDTSTSTSTKVQADVQRLIDMANDYLGISTSIVMQMADVCTNLGYSSYDHSRLIAYINLE